MKQWTPAVVLMLTFWLVMVFFMKLSVPETMDPITRTDHMLTRALGDLDQLHQQNEELQQLMAEYRKLQFITERQKDSTPISGLEASTVQAKDDVSDLTDTPNKGLSYEKEYARRKVESTARELWLFLQAQLSKLAQNPITTKLKQNLDGYRGTMEDDFARLRTADDSEKWRAQMSAELGDLVQRRIQYLQNPDDCSNAKKVVCKLNKGCGFGCQLHHVTYCLITAYATQRTMILESKGWKYAPGGWETLFQPLSSTCQDTGKSRRSLLRSSLKGMNEEQIIVLPFTEALNPVPDFMPQSVPADLAEELSIFHGHPAVWWIGQMVSYLLRPNERLKADLDRAEKRMGFENTIVGIHVRRTDKLKQEASFHSIEEYMTHVESFYNQLERTQTVTARRVYLATDDVTLLAEAKKKYPAYTFISDNAISKSASSARTRYTNSSLVGVLIDIHHLSKCDFLVCTLSSQICRAAYELMQPLHGDASQSVRSLDDVFYFGGQTAHNMKVLEPHAADKDGVIELKAGDAIGIAGNHWDGFSKGLNRRTGVSGLFPSYKIEDTVVAADMPTYPQVPRKRS